MIECKSLLFIFLTFQIFFASEAQDDTFALAVDFNHGKIYQISTNDNPVTKQVSAVDIPQPADPLAAAYIPGTHSVVWSDYMDDQILRTQLNSNKTEIVYSPGMCA